MKQRARRRLLVAAAIVWIFALALSSVPPAAADTKGPCTAGLGQAGYVLTNSDSFDTPGSAFKVDEGAKFEAGMFSPFAGGAAGAGTKKPEEEVVDKIEEISREEETQKELEKARQRAQELRDATFYRAALLVIVFCAVAALPALLLTGMAMISEGGQPASPTPERRLPPPPWRPRISLVALLGGLLAGAGAVVLLQQFSLVFPTRAVAIGGLVIGLAIGVIVPSLTRIIP